MLPWRPSVGGSGPVGRPGHNGGKCAGSLLGAGGPGCYSACMSDAILCHDLRKRYRSRTGPVDAVNGLDLQVYENECFGLLGPNGAGKTTTIEILEGLLPPTSGAVEVLGRHWGEDDDALRQRLGISLQETRL